MFASVVRRHGPERHATPAVSRGSDAGELPPGSVVIEGHSGWVPVDLKELWRYRELIRYLALRDIKVRYAQSILGVAWAVLQPFLTMVVFSVLFGLLMGKDRKPSLEGIPYAVSTYAALVPWQLFARAFTLSGNSLVANQNMITKIYFPRLVAPIAPNIAALVDFAAAFAVLIVMMLFYGIVPSAAVLTLPLFVLLAIATALSVSLWLSALNAVYRDIQHILPFLVHIWMFVTPVVYTTESVMKNQPHWVKVVYGLNPMAGVVEGFRWTLLGGAHTPWLVLGTSIGMVTVLLIGGMFYFRRMERVFADLV